MLVYICINKYTDKSRVKNNNNTGNSRGQQWKLLGKQWK